jgi:hypothetical protein
MVGFPIVFPAYVGDGEREGPGQFPANPMQRIESRAAAIVLARHLPDHHFRIGVHVNRPGIQGHRALQSFQKGKIFRDVVILTPNPLGDSDPAASRIVNYDPNTRGPRVTQRPAIDISHQIRHLCISKMSKKCVPVKPLAWFHQEKCFSRSVAQL